MPSWCQQFCSKLRDSVWFHADVFVILILTAHISLDKMIKKIKNPLETSVLQNKHSDHLYTTLLNTEDKSPPVQVAVLDFIRPRGGGLFLLSAPYPSSSHCSKCSWENKTAIPLGHQEAEAEILLLLPLLLLLLWTNIWTSLQYPVPVTGYSLWLPGLQDTGSFPVAEVWMNVLQLISTLLCSSSSVPARLINHLKYTNKSPSPSLLK